jgi:ATP-dependent RNA helicase DDX10/DBP4
LRSFGSFHDLSAGLLIGGKDVEKEKAVIRDMNILICTPGRLLQHMNETRDFDADNLKCLVLDEVDRLMDMGFKDAID